MFKTVLRVTTALGVLLACYAGYTRVFALVAAGLRSAKDGSTYSHTAAESRTKRQAINLAKQGLPRGHWAAEEDLPIRIYNAERGFWIYAQDYKRLNEGKRIELTPFACIWVSKDGRSLKTATSKSATIDLDQPLGLVSKPGAGGSFKVNHARLEGEVMLRDDKGTPDPTDDLRITGLTYIDYDEATLQILGDDRDTVVMEDAIYRVVGKGLLIQLRPKEEGLAAGTSGFNGAQTAILKRDVFITIYDVGPGGMLPGNPGVKRVTGREPTPLTARSDGMLQVDLPKPRVPARVGPPAPPDPTFAHFHRNVEVLRGKMSLPQDQLNCDVLRLTLVPPEKDSSKPGESDPSEEDLTAEIDNEGSEGSLTLKRAEATGHNVRLISASQGIKARCKELIHKKLAPDSPDETYLRGDAGTKLIVEKTDIAQSGPELGKVTGFTTIRTIDATVFDDGLGNDHSTIVARGPGDLESRPGLNAPVERTAHWLDQLTLQPETNVDKAGLPIVVGKRITLTGSPGFNDLAAKTKLDARDLIVVFLKPNGKTDGAVKGTPKASSPEKDPAVAQASYEIDRLFARQDVHLDAPSKTLIAREWLDAQFESRDGTPPAVTAVAVSSPVVPDPKKKPAVAEAQAKPSEPQSKATANRVSARILLRPGSNPARSSASGGSKGVGTNSPAGTSLLGGGSNQTSEIQSVLLRGKVTYHQDPEQGKTQGTDAVGEAVDIHNRGPNMAKFVIFHRDPETDRASKLSAELLGRVKSAVPPAADEIDATLIPLARIDIDDMTFKGQVIGVDQSTDEAWIDGRGSLTKLAAVGLLSDKGLPSKSAVPSKPAISRGEKSAAKPGSAPTEPAKTTPMTISFESRMKFFGRSTNMKGQPAGRAEFYKNVHAETSESILECKDVMRVFLDRTVKLARVSNPAGNAEPNPEIAVIECVEDVVAINEKLDPASKQVLQKQRIEGDHLVYEKLAGNFTMRTPGIVYLYEREGQSGPGQGLGLPGGTAPRQGQPSPAARNSNGRVIRPTSGPGEGQKPPVIGHNGARKPADPKRPAQPATSPLQALAAARPLPPLILTQVRFSREMVGRFGSGKVEDKSEIRWADFFGEVEALRGKVPNAEAVLDPDNRAADDLFLTSNILRVVSEPSPINPDAPPRNLLAAWENAFASDSDKTIQADRITFDSTTNLFYAYGDDGREVLISQQDQFGQPASFSRSGGVRFNAKTGQSSLIDPKIGSMIQARTGTRPTPGYAPKDIAPRNQKRTPFRNPRNIERKDFTGR